MVRFRLPTRALPGSGQGEGRSEVSTPVGSEAQAASKADDACVRRQILTGSPVRALL
jgi:hypothetical protein